MEAVRERPLLILDLDETLVWATRELSAVPHDFRVFGYYVTKRPHLWVFLRQVFSWFDVAVWTSAGEHYASAVVAEIFDDPSQLLFVWSASRCTERIDRESGERYDLKDLKKVKRKGFPLERTLMIDDSPEKLGRQYGNHLRLHPFEGDAEDRELLDVLPFLDWLRMQDDFRRIEKRTWRKRELP
jgi:RNA polymerase II subunit A small phosphatase-like protein